MRLLLLRHAAAAPVGDSDLERPLTSAGRRDGTRLGAHLRAHPAVDHAIVSPAVRARQTLAALGLDAPATVLPQLYNGAPEDLLQAVRESAPEAAQTVLVVAHNPGIHALAVDLLAGDRSALNGYPPGALCVLEVPAPWSALALGTGDLLEFVTPAGLAAAPPS